jgi:pyruvate/2-oxoglutarate dehydrogenase complex dihydrolipoamide acyltransferase (E2) component
MKKDIQFNTTWRKVASTIYKKPVDSKIFGGVEFDITELEKFVSSKRKEGLKITFTHFFVLAIAKALKKEIPEFNTYIRRGKINSRPSIDAVVSVLQSDESMSSIMIPKADEFNFKNLELYMNSEIIKSRRGDENGTMKNKNFIALLPWPFRNWFFYIYKTIAINWGIYMPVLGLSPNSFGSFLITNIGSLGIDYGFPALLPSSNLSFVFVMGGIQKKPVVINDEIVIRKMMSVSIVFDHRLTDASHAARLLRFLKQAIKHPYQFE